MRIVLLGGRFFINVVSHIDEESIEEICEYCSLYRDPLCWKAICGRQYYKEIKIRRSYEKEDSIARKEDDSSRS